MSVRNALCVALAAWVASCGPGHSPNTDASNAAQQANKVDHGILVVVREVAISAPATAGAIDALSGSLMAGIAGSATEHATGDTRVFEYIVRKANGNLLSVTQKDAVPLATGQKVLVTTGNQARVLSDTNAPLEQPPKQATAASPTVVRGP